MRRPTEFYLGLWTLVFLGGLAVVVFAQPFVQPQAPATIPLTLKASDQNGRIRVDWDARHPAVLNADAAVLEVQDGDAHHRYPVDRQVLHSGGFDYLRKSTDVLLTFTLLRYGQPGQQATVRTIGAIPQVKVAQAERPASRSRQTRGRRR